MQIRTQHRGLRNIRGCRVFGKKHRTSGLSTNDSEAPHRGVLASCRLEDRPHQPESEWIMVEDHHIPIIDPQQWHNVNEILRGNRRIEVGGLAYNRKNIHIFAGLLTCGNCGSKMAAQPSNVRASGWRPSMYSCYNRRQSSKCTNKYVSESRRSQFRMGVLSRTRHTSCFNSL